MPGKVKGVNMLALVKLLRKAGTETAMKVVPPAYRHYLQERILISNRYPEIDHVELLRAASRLMPPKPEPWVVMGRHSAQAASTRRTFVPAIRCARSSRRARCGATITTAAK